jgi:hypothetical protein
MKEISNEFIKLIQDKGYPIDIQVIYLPKIQEWLRNTYKIHVNPIPLYGKLLGSVRYKIVYNCHISYDLFPDEEAFYNYYIWEPDMKDLKHMGVAFYKMYENFDDALIDGILMVLDTIEVNSAGNFLVNAKKFPK